MKKYFNYSLMLMLVGLLFASCADEYKSYTPAKIDTDQVYFSKDLSHDFDLEDFDETEITIPVSRQKTDNELTVQLGLIDPQDTVFTLKTKTVTFPAGAATANAVVTFDASKWAYDDFKTGSIYIVDDAIEPEELVLPEDPTAADSTEVEKKSAPRKAQEQTNTPNPQYTTQWGDHSFYFIVGVPAPFETVGIGSFTDNFFLGQSCEVTILHNTVDPNIYRVVDPWGSFGQPAFDETRTLNLDIRILKAGEEVNGVEIPQDGLVYYAPFNTGYYFKQYQDYAVMEHPILHYDDGAVLENNIVLEYQEDGTPGIIQIAPVFWIAKAGGGYWMDTESDIVTITFPGYEPKDFSLEIQHKGIFTNLEEKPYAVVSATLGEDALSSTVKGVVIEADADPDAVADAIEAGELEAQELDLTNMDNILVEIPEGLTGKLQVILVVIDEDGKAKAVSSANFEYYGKGDANPWQSLGIGLYTDPFLKTVYTRNDEAPAAIGPYEVEVQENAETPGLYRIVNPYAPGVHPSIAADDPDATYTPANIEIDATDPEGVFIQAQSTGLNWGSGVIYIASNGGYSLQQADFATLKENGYFGKLENGIITLPTFQTKKGTIYQGMLFDDDGGYYAGVEDGFKLVLPEAVTSDARRRVTAINNWTGLVRKYNAKKIEKKDRYPLKDNVQITKTKK